MKFSLAILIVFIAGSQIRGSNAAFHTDKFGEEKIGGYVVRNNVWGDGAGSQNITVTDQGHWCIHCSHLKQGGIKSYPHTGYMINKPLSAIHGLTSTYGAKVDNKQGLLAYSLTYDIWLQKHKYEIMIWVQYCGPIGPIGGRTNDNVQIAGYKWNVHKGTNGVNQVFSFLNVGQSEKGSIDLKAILDWICQQNWFNEKEATLLDEVQFGFEITNSPANTNFCLNDFSCTVK
ncbi:hypothetical protein M8J76_008191 [Diaphorina citri]|nr:hypothetical protein M8J76_008191 [Diaphorina citri]KAI5751928.1 hypothetical protein M8J77_012175 [Diaphorina citri]